MARLKRVLVLAAALATLGGLGMPATAESGARPLRDPVASGRWGPLVPVPIPKGNIDVEDTAISEQGHVAVAYRDYTPVGEGDLPGYVIVRGRGGVWGERHRLNPPNTRIVSVELALDAHGDLTAVWSWVDAGECCGAPETTRFAVATKPADGTWGEQLQAGSNHSYVGDFVLSVAPSGKAVISWWQSREPEPFQFRYRLAVRVRAATDAPWGPP